MSEGTDEDWVTFDTDMMVTFDTEETELFEGAEGYVEFIPDFRAFCVKRAVRCLFKGIVMITLYWYNK